MLLFNLVVLGVLGLDPQPVAIETRVDWVEFNNYYDGEGKLVFKQIIFWGRAYIPNKPKDWCGPWTPWQDVVIAWRIVKRWPERRRVAGRWRLTWCDNGKLRTVTARGIVESWTQHDPEVWNRRIWPRKMQVGLQ